MKLIDALAETILKAQEVHGSKCINKIELSPGAYRQLQWEAAGKQDNLYLQYDPSKPHKFKICGVPIEKDWT